MENQEPQGADSTSPLLLTQNHTACGPQTTGTRAHSSVLLLPQVLIVSILSVMVSMYFGKCRNTEVGAMPSGRAHEDRGEAAGNRTHRTVSDSTYSQVYTDSVSTRKLTDQDRWLGLYTHCWADTSTVKVVTAAGTQQPTH